MTKIFVLCFSAVLLAGGIYGPSPAPVERPREVRHWRSVPMLDAEDLREDVRDSVDAANYSESSGCGDYQSMKESSQQRQVPNSSGSDAP